MKYQEGLPYMYYLVLSFICNTVNTSVVSIVLMYFT